MRKPHASSYDHLALIEKSYMTSRIKFFVC